jgi:Flp pilus assembly protein TadG
MSKLFAWGTARFPRSRTPSSRMSRGQSVVEFALVLPVFLILLLTAIDFGRLFFSFIEMNNAAREGAAYAATNPTNTVEIQRHILLETNAQSQVGAGTLSAPSVTCKDNTGAEMACSSAGGGSGPGNTVTVRATEPFTFFTPFINGFFGNSFSMSASSTAAVLEYAASSSGTNPGGCPPPTPNFTLVADHMTITTDPSGSRPNSGVCNISGYNWNWGDGQTDVGTASSTVHVYLWPGKFTVQLTTTNQDGEATRTEDVIVPPGTTPPSCTKPIANFTATDDGHKTFDFKDTSTVADPVNCPITSWAWSFGDKTPPTTSNAQNPSFTYATSSSHTVTLIVTNSAGASLPVSKSQ